MSKRPRILSDLAALIDKDGRTIYELSKDAEVDKQLVYSLMTGVGTKPIERMAAIGKALGYTLTWTREK